MTTPIGTASVRIVGDLTELARSLQGANLGANIRQSLTVDTSQLQAAAGDIGREIAKAIVAELRASLGSLLTVTVQQQTRQAGDQAGPAARKAGEDVGKKVADGAKDGSSGIGEAIKGNLGKIAGIAAGLGGLDLLGKVFSTGADEEKDYESGLANLNTLITNSGGAAGVTADQLEKQATQLQNLSGQTDDSVVAAETFLLKQGNIKDAVGAGNDVLTRATELSVNIAAVQGGDASTAAAKLAKALEDPATGYKALSKAGLDLTDAQKAAIKADQARGDSLSGQKVILDALSKEYAGAAQAQGNTIEGEKNKATRSFEDLSQSVYAAFLPLLNAVLPGLITVISTVADDIGPVLSGITSFLTPLGTVIGDFFTQLGNGEGPVAGLTSKVGGFAASVIPAAEAIGAKLLPVLQELGRDALPVLSAAIGTAIAYYGDLAAIVRTAVATALPLVSKALAVTEPILRRIAAEVIPLLVKGFALVRQAFATVAAVIQDAIQQLLPKLEELYVRALPAVQRVISALQPVIEKIISVVQFLLPIIQFIAHILIDVLKVAFDVLIPVIVFVINVIADLITIGNKIVDFLIRQFKDALDKAKPSLDAIGQAISSVGDFFSKLGVDVAHFAGSFLGDLAQLLKYFTEFGDNLLSTAASAFGWIPGIGDAIKSARSAFDSGLNDITGDLTTAASVLNDVGHMAGSNVVDGLVKGISDNDYKVQSAAIDLAQKTNAAFRSKDGFETQSPSKKTTKIGGDVVDGLLVPLRGRTDELRRAATANARAVLTGMSAVTALPFSRPDLTAVSASGTAASGGMSAAQHAQLIGQAVGQALDGAAVRSYAGGSTRSRQQLRMAG